MSLDLLEPLGLLSLLTLVPLAILFRKSGVPQPRWRRVLGLLLRTGSVLSLALAISGARLVRANDRLVVMFCLDWSDSIDPRAKRDAMMAIEAAARPLGASSGRSSAEDRAGLVVFGREPEIEEPPSPSLAVREPTAVVETGATDVGRAIRLAAATFPSDARRRIVVVSDGNENSGDALREAELAASSGVDIDAIVLETSPPGQEVLVQSVRAPHKVKQGEVFDLDVVIRARRAGRATVRVVRRGGKTETLLPAREVKLEAGENRLVPPIRDRLVDEDSYVYEVVVEAPDDANPSNNRGEALVEVGGATRVLYAEGVRGEDRYLRAALEKAGMRVDVVGPGETPASLEDVARYDAIFFSDIDASSLTPAQMGQYRDYVRFMGGGFVMAGGPSSFGAGGYYRTPIEEALPVTMDIRHEKHLPSLALVLCIDKSGSMSETTPTGAQKMEVAVEGAVLTMGLLSDRDYVGVIAFDDAAKWVVPLRRADDKEGIAAQIRTIRAGGGTDMYPAVREAHDALRGVEVQIKHVIALTDGITNPADFPALLPKLRADKITVSTVGIGSDADMKFLEWLAREGQGRAFFARSVAQVPRILTKDTLLATRSLIVTSDRGIPVEPRLPSQILKGLDALPPVYGFVQTTPKDRADVVLTTPKDDPLLATWQYGLGRSIAWAPDLKSGWGRDWVRWPGYDAFFVQAAKWIARASDRGGFRTDVFIEGGKGKIIVEAFDENGEYRNFLDLHALTTGPAGSSREVTLEETAAGHYEAQFDAIKAGPYFATVAERKPAAGDAEPALERIATAGAVQNYPAEYRDMEPNPGLLKRLVEIGHGRSWKAGEDGPDVFRRSGPVVRAFAPLWFELMVLAAVLLLAEISVRRLSIPPAVLAALTLRRARAEPKVEVLERLKRRKEAVRYGGAPEDRTSTAPVPVSPPSAPDVGWPAPPPGNAAPPSGAAMAPTPAAPPAVPPEQTASPATAEPLPKPAAVTDAAPPRAAPEEGAETTARLLDAKRRARER